MAAEAHHKAQARCRCSRNCKLLGITFSSSPRMLTGAPRKRCAAMNFSFTHNAVFTRKTSARHLCVKIHRFSETLVVLYPGATVSTRTKQLKPYSAPYHTHAGARYGAGAQLPPAAFDGPKRDSIRENMFTASFLEASSSSWSSKSGPRHMVLSITG
jgi:hypothetical protein